MQNLGASKGETCCAGKSVSTPKFLRKCGRECGSQRPFRGREVVRELVYNDELAATQWALNSAVECHPHTVEVVGSNPTAPTITHQRLETDYAFVPLPTLAPAPDPKGWRSGRAFSKRPPEAQVCLLGSCGFPPFAGQSEAATSVKFLAS